MRYTAFITLLALLVMNAMGVAHAAVDHAHAGQGHAHVVMADHTTATDNTADGSMGGHHHFCHWYAQRLYLSVDIVSSHLAPVSASPAVLPVVYSPPARPPRA